MNICVLIKSTLYHKMGGMEVHAKTISEVASTKGHSVAVVTTQHPKGLEFEEKNGVQYHFLPDTKPACYTKKWFKDSLYKIFELHKKKNFDVIWAETYSGYAYISQGRPVINVPLVSIIQSLGIIGYISTGWGAANSLSEVFNFSIKYLPEAFFVYLPYFFRVVRRSDAVAAVSNETAAAISREFVPNPAKIHVVYNSIDINLFKPDPKIRADIRRKYFLSEDIQIILMASVLHKQKGVHHGLQAFSLILGRLPNAKLMIVGDSPYRKYFEDLAITLKIKDSVIFCGMVPNDQTPSYYNAADLLLNPSARAEGLPIVIIEALSCGLPVVTTIAGGTPSAIDEGVCGYLVKQKDISGMADRVVQLLNNQQKLKDFSIKARDKAVTTFSNDIVVNKLINISKGLKINDKK